MLVSTANKCLPSSLGPPISDALNSPIEVAVPESFGRATSAALGKFQGHGPSVKRTAPEIDTNAAAKIIGTNTLAPPRSADHPTLPDKRGANIKKPYDEKSVKKTYGEIVFVRMRIFYAKPKHNAGGKISFGLKRIRMYALLFDRGSIGDLKIAAAAA
jgi:hypothetical protein